MALLLIVNFHDTESYNPQIIHTVCASSWLVHSNLTQTLQANLTGTGAITGLPFVNIPPVAVEKTLKIWVNELHKFKMNSMG